jgi:proteic killer suppression protein
MIRSFRSSEARRIFEGLRSRRFANLQSMIERKLQLLDSASTLGDLASPPNNRLEALKGDRKGQHSIRVNDQFRLCFRWTSEGPEDVDLVDYH